MSLGLSANFSSSATLSPSAMRCSEYAKNGKAKKAHHGDFYFRKVATAGEAQAAWFVIEVKGVKSNSEKWHKLYNRRNEEEHA